MAHAWTLTLQEVGFVTQRVRVTVTRTYTYTPALEDLEYTTAGIATAEQALEYDKKSYEEGELSLEELVTTDPLEISTWSIVDE